LLTVTVTVAVLVGQVTGGTGTEVVMTWTELVLVGGAGLHFPFRAVP